jgi:hypothetical protein
MIIPLTNTHITALETTTASLLLRIQITLLIVIEVTQLFVNQLVSCSGLRCDRKVLAGERKR